MTTRILSIMIMALSLLVIIPAGSFASDTADPSEQQYEGDYDYEAPPAEGVSPAHPGIRPPRLCMHNRPGHGGMHRSMRAPHGRGVRDGFHRRGGQRGMGLAAERLLKSAQFLDLTEEQVNKLEKMAYDVKKQLIDLRAEVAKERLEMRQLRRSESDDLAKYKTHINNIAEKRAQMEQVLIATWIEARKILTDEQKKMLDQRRYGERASCPRITEELQEEDD